jgi:hypothetical protein
MDRLKVKCVDNRPYLQEKGGAFIQTFGSGSMISLTLGKVYEVIGIEHGWYRILDDTDEDYLYPSEMFRLVD